MRYYISFDILEIDHLIKAGDKYIIINSIHELVQQLPFISDIKCIDISHNISEAERLVIQNILEIKGLYLMAS